MKVKELLRKEYHDIELAALPRASVYAIKKISSTKQQVLNELFGINTIEELAGFDAYKNAERILDFYEGKRGIIREYDESIIGYIKDEYCATPLSRAGMIPVRALEGLSDEQAYALEKYFGAETLSRLRARPEFMAAAAILETAYENESKKEAEEEQTFRRHLHSKYKEVSAVKLMDAPLWALKVRKDELEYLEYNFSLFKVKDLISWEPYLTAHMVYEESQYVRADDDARLNEILYSRLNPPYETYSPEELLNAPLTAIAGISKSKAQLIKKAFGAETIEELALSRMFSCAREIAYHAGISKGRVNALKAKPAKRRGSSTYIFYTAIFTGIFLSLAAIVYFVLTILSF